MAVRQRQINRQRRVPSGLIQPADIAPRDSLAAYR